MITTALYLISLVAGVFFLVIAGWGIIRMPDLYCRMHASTKAASMGIGLVVLATAIYFGETAVSTKALMIVVFIFLTAPVAGHLLGRAVHMRSDPERDWEKQDKR